MLVLLLMVVVRLVAISCFLMIDVHMIVGLFFVYCYGISLIFQMVQILIVILLLNV
jgi:tetrahydromethanopterin S-methyltransferase subunit D